MGKCYTYLPMSIFIMHSKKANINFFLFNPYVAGGKICKKTCNLGIWVFI